MRAVVLSLFGLVLVASCSSGGGGGGGGGGTTAPDVFYVRTNAGNDRNDGLTPATAFQTISAAASRVRAGDTVIVGPGTYKEAVIDPMGGTEVDPVIFLADANGSMTNGPPGQVVIDATGIVDDQNSRAPAFRLSNGSFVIIDGFGITGGATAGIQVRINSNGTVVRNCQVYLNSGDGVLVQSSSDVTLFNNAIYSNTRRGTAIVGSPRTRLINNTITLNEDRGIFIGTRQEVPSPGAVLRNNIIQDSVEANVQVSEEPGSRDGYDPLVNLVFTGRYQPTDLPRPGDINEDAQFISAVLGNFRLTGASPAINAAVTDSLSADEILTLQARSTSFDGTVDSSPLDLGFHYPAGSALPPPSAKVYYVRASGSDTNDGLSPQSAYRTIGKAARTAVAGDQVIVGPGRYTEGLISPPSGTATAPVLLRANPNGGLTDDSPGRVLLDADGEVAGFRLSQVEFVTLDGFTVTGGRQSGIQVRSGSRRVTIQNCEVLANGDGIRLENSREVLLFNNLVARNQTRGILIAGTVSGTQNAQVVNNTVTQNKDRGIFIGASECDRDPEMLFCSTGTIVQNNVVQLNDKTSVQVTDGSETGFMELYNVVFPLSGPDAYFPRNLPRTEDINENAEFVGGPDGDFYLDQALSPAVDSGDAQLRGDLREILANRTTDPSGRPDTGRVDRGYHFPR